MNMLKKAAINFRTFKKPLSSASTVDSSELQHFKQFTKEWWNEGGHMKPLHSLNKLRVPLIRNGVIDVNRIPYHIANSPKPLTGYTILDVGCGGGILTESLARIGGAITGLDANSDLIEKAKAHTNDNNIQYICSSIEEHECEFTEKYEVVVASEVLEHVTKKEEFLKACVNCLKPGGSIFVTTMNKTSIANILAIMLAENVFHIVPKGTHEYDKFIEPYKLQSILEDFGCKTILVNGLGYNFLSNEWFWTSNNSINYALHAIKLKNNLFE